MLNLLDFDLSQAHVGPEHIFSKTAGEIYMPAQYELGDAGPVFVTLVEA